MSKQQSDPLFQLVKSTTKAEKRHFKLYCNRLSAGQDALFVQLFDAIDLQKEYDEAAILKRVPGIRKAQLANVRSHLYKQLLTSLRLLKGNHSEEIAIRDQLDFAGILYAKGLYRQSLHLLQRARKRALDLAFYPLGLEITAFEKLIASQYFTLSTDTSVEDLCVQSSEIARTASIENAYSNLSLQLYGLYVRIGHAKNAQELAHAHVFLEEHLPPYSESELSFYARLHLYQSYVWFYNITQEFRRQYRVAQKAVDLFHANREMIRHNIPLYLKSLHNLLNTLFLTMRYGKFRAALRQLRHFTVDQNYQLTMSEASLHQQTTYMHRINLHFLEGSFSEGTRWVGELEEILEQDSTGWDEHRILTFYYKIACLYFGAGDNGASIEFLNKIIQRGSPDLGEDIQCFARILNLIANYEMGNDELVPYQIKSVYRFLLKIEELNATHEAILKFLRTTPHMKREALSAEFAVLKEQLLAIQSARFERRSSLYLDIISWLESKIEGVPVQNVIRRKFEERYVVAER